MTLPKVGDLCSIEYRVQGNGPWNYLVERPPEGVTHARLTARSLGLVNSQSPVLNANDSSPHAFWEFRLGSWEFEP